jgi:hypothetical protein
VTRPGARVSARTGYAPPKAAPLDRRRAIDAALTAPFAQQALRVEYTTYLLRAENAGRTRVILSLEADLPLRDERHQAADVVFVVRDMRDGRVVASGTGTMALPVDPADAAPTGVGRHRVHFDVPPGSYMMRAVVREPGGLIGSADRRLDVRGVTGPDVAVSDVMLTSATGPLPVRARVYTEDGLSGMLEAYGRSSEQLDGLLVMASLLASGKDIPVATVRSDMDPALSAGSAGVVRRAKFDFPLRNLDPGTYLARVKVQSGAETVADLTRELEVVAGRAPIVAPSAAPVAIRPADILNGDFVRKARETLRVASTAAAVQATRGFELFADADYPAAAAALGDALRLDKSQATVAFVLGWAHEAAGDRRQAIGAWRAAATIDSKMVPAHLALAEAYLRMSERALAIQALRAGLLSLPDSPELLARLAAIENGK